MESVLDRTLKVLNTIVMALAVWIIFSLSRRTHQFPVAQLFWLVPPLATWVSLSHHNRTLGGIAVLANGLLGLAGGLTAAVALLGGGNPAGKFEPVLALGGLFLLGVGILNFRSVWAAYPKIEQKPKGGAANGSSI